VPLPEYQVRGKYNDTFHIEVVVDGISYGSGFGSTKKQAEQFAAQIALKTTDRFKK
jgi:dsRNA-specific ribonuclease